MAVTHQFYSRRDSDGGEEIFALAREVVTDEIFILHSRTRPLGGVFPHEEKRISLADFLSQAGPGRSDLLGLIGTLVVEK